jgi:hypothetical protein
MVKLPKLQPNALDLGAALVGFGLLEWGVARLSVEAALIMAGVLLLAGALWRPKTDG